MLSSTKQFLKNLLKIKHGKVKYEVGINQVKFTQNGLSIAVIENVEQKEARYVGIFLMSELKKAEENIHHMALFDALTELPNCAFSYNHLRQVLSQAEQNFSFSTLMMLGIL